MVYPGCWDSARVSGELLYPVFPSESDGLFWTGEQGSFGMGHGIFRHQVFGGRLGRQ
jgi:hypothetical protein